MPMHLGIVSALALSASFQSCALQPRIATRCAPLQLSQAGAGASDVVVSRTPEGSLGVIVDQDNTVVEVTAQPELQPGDVIVAVDGEMLDGRAIGQVLTPGASQYTFSISRPSAGKAAESLERVLIQLARDGSASMQGLLSTKAEGIADGVAERCASLVKQLETSGMAPKPDALQASLTDGAFWRLMLTSDGKLAKAGLTGYGLAPYCAVLASFQLFKPPDAKPPTAQVVEVVANGYTGVSTTAALKGRWEAVQLGEQAEMSGVRETYERTEYNGAPETDAPIAINEWPCTYLSDTLRVCRYKSADGDADAEGEDLWRIYERVDGEKAQAQIGRLLELPVPRVEEIPLWARERPDSSPPGDGPMADATR